MKNLLIEIVNKYLEVYDEEKRQSFLLNYLVNHTDAEIIDWNNFDGHVVASGFIYSKEDKKFLVLYHKDMKIYLYPGGHMDSSDVNSLEAAKREVLEETGLSNLKQVLLSDDSLIPIDIDTHLIGYNERLSLPEHYHFDFRYLFVVDKIQDINTDSDELGDYRWIGMEELEKDSNYGKVVVKIRELIKTL